MRKIITFILVALALPLMASAQGKLTAQQVLDKSVASITGSKGLTANFSYNAGGAKGSGTIKNSGNKFMVTLPDVQVWYNGKQLYTYNKRSSETTRLTPSMQELAESNPLLYVKGAQGKYTPAFSQQKQAGKYIIELSPKNKTAEMKKIVLTLRTSDFMPEKIVATPRTGSQTVITVSGIKNGVSIAASEFEYPKTKLPKVSIIDL